MFVRINRVLTVWSGRVRSGPDFQFSFTMMFSIIAPCWYGTGGGMYEVLDSSLVKSKSSVSNDVVKKVKKVLFPGAGSLLM